MTFPFQCLIVKIGIFPMPNNTHHVLPQLAITWHQTTVPASYSTNYATPTQNMKEKHLHALLRHLYPL